MRVGIDSITYTISADLSGISLTGPRSEIEPLCDPEAVVTFTACMTGRNGGPGPGVRDYLTYVDDCIIAGIDALAARNLTKETINLACGRGSTFVDGVTILSRSHWGKPQTYPTNQPALVK